MGNCCHPGESKAASSAAHLARQHELDEAKRAETEQLRNGITSMANGGHQMLSSFTAPYHFTPQPGRQYFKLGWPPSGSVLITSFGVRVVAQGQNVEFVEGLANYATMMCSWKQSAESKGKQVLYEVRLDQYHSVDANTGEQTPVKTSPKLFLVDGTTGAFVRVLNVEELVDEAVNLAVAAATAEKTAAQKEELRRLLLQQREVMIKGVCDDIALMWRCWAEIWTHEEVETPSSTVETIWGTKCTRRKRVVQSDQAENRKVLDRFYDDFFANVSHQNLAITRQQVQLDKATQLQVYNGLFTIEGGIRCHQASYRKLTESTITIQGQTSSRAEFEGKRWVFGWDSIPELTSRAYMVSLFSEYASVGGAFHDRLTEKYTGHGVGGDPKVDIHQMLIDHRFVTEPDEGVVIADQTKQKIAGMLQMSQGAHSMFSGLSPPIEYPPKDSNAEYFQFRWPKEGLVKVCALGFTIKVVDNDVAFTQGLGTFIMFDVRWHRCVDFAKHGVPEGSVEVLLENNILISAQSGTEEPLTEPVKHLLIGADGTLLKIVNMEELVEYAIETAIAQRGAQTTAEEKAQYRAMLIDTQRATLTKAVQCDLAFIWASWVQQWTHQRKSASVAESQNFGLTTVELSQKHASSPEENKKTVTGLIHSVISNSATSADGTPAAANNSTAESRLSMEREIEVVVARQEESYTTLFEKDTCRPFVASYQKVTHTELALHVTPPESAGSSSTPVQHTGPPLHSITQVEYKNSRHVFIWGDVPQLSTKDYIQGVYQSYLDAANTAYADLLSSKAKAK